MNLGLVSHPKNPKKVNLLPLPESYIPKPYRSQEKQCGCTYLVVDIDNVVMKLQQVLALYHKFHLIDLRKRSKRASLFFCLKIIVQRKESENECENEENRMRIFALALFKTPRTNQRACRSTSGWEKISRNGALAIFLQQLNRALA